MQRRPRDEGGTCARGSTCSSHSAAGASARRSCAPTTRSPARKSSIGRGLAGTDTDPHLPERRLHLFDSSALCLLSAARRVADRACDFDHELPVGVQLTRGLRLERGLRIPQRLQRLALHLLRRSRQTKPGSVHVSKLPNKATRAALLGLRHVLRKRTRLLERVEEASVAQRHEETRPSHTLPQRLPLLIREIRSGG